MLINLRPLSPFAEKCPLISSRRIRLAKIPQLCSRFPRGMAGVAMLFLLPFWKWENASGQTSGSSPLWLDPQKALTQYAHDVWNRDQGLPQSAIQALAQTPDGYLWIGLEEGLTRFDGVQFTLYSKANTAAITYNNIQALVVGKDSSLWIGTNGGGVIRLKDGQFTAYTTAGGLANDIVKAVYEDREGNLWIGSNGGLNRLSNGKWTLYTTKEGLANDVVQAIYEDRQGRLWIGTDGGGLNCLANGKFLTYTTTEGLSNNEVTSIYEDPAARGNLWIGTNNGLNRWQNGRFIRYTTVEGLASNFVRAIYEDRAGSLWIGTYGGGLNRFANGQFETFSTPDGLSNDFVRALCEDREGSLWIGTYGGGLNRLRNGKFTTYSTRHGLSNDMVWSIYEDRANNLWIGTDRGLNRFKDGKFTVYNLKDVPLNVVVALHEDRAGNLWIGTEGGALIRYKNGAFVLYTTKEGLASNFVRAIIEDRKGNLWIGTDRGLNLFQNGKFKTYTTKDGLSNDEVRYLFEDRAGGLWIGTRTGGLTRLHNGAFTRYTTREGLSSDLIRPIYEDPADSGTLWIGTNGGGLNRFKDGKFVQYTMKDGLFDDVIFQILDDRQGYFWMTCNNGIFRVSKQELDDFAAGKRKAITSVAYGKADGMGTNECNGGSQPAGWRSRDGRLWFPTIKGVAMIDPGRLVSNPLPPPVRVETMIVDYHSLPAQADLELAPGSRNFEIHYTGLSLVAPSKVLFKYKLENFDPEWVEVGPRRVAYFTNVPPGKYKFFVTACNNDGVWSEKEKEFAFVLQPHFYQTVWFYSLLFLSLVLSGAGAYRYHVRQIRRREEDAALRRTKAELETRVQERTAELTQANDTLQTEIAERQRLGETLRESEERFRQLTENIQEVFWMTDPEKNKIIYASPAVEKVWGLRREEVYAEPRKWVESLHPDDRERVLQAALTKQVAGEYDEIYRMYRPDGGMRWIRDRAFPIRNEEGRVYRIAGIAEDITIRKQAEATIQRRVQELSTLNDLGREMAQSFTTRELCQKVADKLREAFGYFNVGILTVVPEGWRLVLQGISGGYQNLLQPEEHHLAFGQGIIGRVAESENLLVVNDTRQHPDFFEVEGLHILSEAALPLKIGNRVIGVLNVDSEELDHFTESEMAVLQTVADQVSIALEKTRLLEALRESEERFRQLTENIKEVFWMTDPAKNRMIYVSPAYEEIWGRSSASLYESPRNWLIAIHAEDLQRVYESMLTKQTAGQYDEIYRIQRPDGSQRWIRDRAFPICDEQGKVYRLAGLAEDITTLKQAESDIRRLKEGLEKRVLERTAELRGANAALQREVAERQRAQEQLQESESRFRQLAENIDQVLWMESLDRRQLLYVSPAYEKIWGRSLAGLREQPNTFLESVYEDDRERFTAHLAQQRQGEFSEIEYRIQRPDGERRWIRDRSFPIRDANGKAYRSAGISEDITERKEVEEEIQKNQKLLTEAQNMAHLGNFEWNVRTNKVTWSEELYRIYGLDPATFGATFEAFLGRLHPDDRERAKTVIAAAFRECKPFQMEERVVRPDGTIRVLATQGEILTDEKGAPARMIGVCQDVTERKRIEAQLREHTEGLEKLVEARAARIQELERQRAESDKLAVAGRMAARIAHEVNNPLAGIQSSFQLLKGAISPTHRYYHYAGIIESEIERIANIIRQMYDLYRPEKESVRPFRVDQTIRDVVALLKAGSHDRGVHIESDANGAFDTITLSEGLLRQVLYNLIQNALEASPAGSIVRVSAATAPNLLKIAVADQGHGIPAELRSQIFEPFFTTKTGENRTGGLGLGLSVTKSIVDAMKGTIDFESQVGNGTVFRIELPV